MPRANRHFISGYVWHITHRCHKKEFLLKFAQDRQRWLYWLFEARKRFGLCILNYIVTSNHIHLLVKDTGMGVISNSLQLIAGRTAQEYNRRKHRKGAFWEDRYHATAVQSNEHLAKCLVYIDLNMVRAGVVNHPSEWRWSGYNEIQSPPKRYRLIDLTELVTLAGTNSLLSLQDHHRTWVETELKNDQPKRLEKWSQSLAVGDEQFVKRIQTELGYAATYRETSKDDGAYVLRESAESYNGVFATKKVILSDENTII